MNVADLELCKELYAVSGGKWHVRSPMYVWIKYPKGVYKGSSNNRTYEGEDWNNVKCVFSNYRGRSENIAPAYDLGYLIRQLPPDIGLDLQKRVDYEDSEWSWNCVAQSPDGFYWVEDGFLEDVVCQLLIELFKQRILTN